MPASSPSRWSSPRGRSPRYLIAAEGAPGCPRETARQSWRVMPQEDRSMPSWPSGRPMEPWSCAAGAARSGPATRPAERASVPSSRTTGDSYLTAPHPEEGFVHEWLHQVEATYRDLGFGEDVVPPLHDAEILTSSRPPTEPPHGDTYRVHHDRAGHTWQPWYHDYMTGHVRRPGDGACFGLAPEVWAARGERPPQRR